MVEMTVQYQITRDEIATVTGEFVGVELGPIPSVCLPLRLEDNSWHFIAFGAIIDIKCKEMPDAFVVPVQHMLEAVKMHRSAFEDEKARFDKEHVKPNFTDANWGHV